jgi:hypothetical protein
MSFDVNNPADVQALNTEVYTDPIGMGYAAVINSTADLLALLNEVESNVVPTKVNYPEILSDDVRAATTYVAFDNLLTPEQDWLRWMTGFSADGIPNMPATAELKQKLAGVPTATGSIWATADRTEMNAAMLALFQRDGSRAEVLFGFGTVITANDWFAARNPS